MSPATAADLPPELIDRIVRWFCSLYVSEFEDPVNASKHELGLLSLTCRHWAYLIRRHIFGELTLRTSQDLDTFMELIDSPVKVEPTIINSLSNLILDYRGPWVELWIHRVYAGMASKCGVDALQVLDSGGITLRLSGVYRREDSTLDDKYAPTTWCEGLPKSLPGTMFHMETLVLCDLRFHSTAGLLRFIQGIPSLGELSCTKLRFDKDMPPLFTDRHRRARNCLHQVQVTECGSSSDDLNLAVWIFRIQTPHGRFKPVIRDHFSHWNALHEAARSICGSSTFKRISLVPQMHMDPPGCDLYVHMLDSQAAVSHELCVQVQLPPDSNSTVAIKTLTLEFHRRAKADDVASMDWRAIEQAALDMHPSEKLCIYALALPVFEWFLDAMPAGRVLPQLRHPRDVEIVHGYPPFAKAPPRKDAITAEKILHAPSTYTVDGQTVQLKRPQIIHLAGCTSDVKKQAFLREVLASSQDKLQQPQIDGAPTSSKGTAVVIPFR